MQHVPQSVQGKKNVKPIISSHLCVLSPGPLPCSLDASPQIVGATPIHFFVYSFIQSYSWFCLAVTPICQNTHLILDCFQVLSQRCCIQVLVTHLTCLVRLDRYNELLIFLLPHWAQIFWSVNLTLWLPEQHVDSACEVHVHQLTGCEQVGPCVHHLTTRQHYWASALEKWGYLTQGISGFNDKNHQDVRYPLIGESHHVELAVQKYASPHFALIVRKAMSREVFLQYIAAKRRVQLCEALSWDSDSCIVITSYRMVTIYSPWGPPRP